MVKGNHSKMKFSYSIRIKDYTVSYKKTDGYTTSGQTDTTSGQTSNTGGGRVIRVTRRALQVEEEYYVWVVMSG